MSDETFLTIKGRLTADPETRFTQSGAAVSNFTVAVNARKLDKASGEWKNKPAKFWRCQAWSQGKLARAENIADTLKKGDSVLVYGELETREYDKDGQTRSADEIRVESIGKDLTFHGQAGEKQRPSAAQSQQFNGAQQQGFGQQPQGGGFGGQQQQSGNFGAQQQNQGGWGNQQGQPANQWGNGQNSEAPF